MSEANKPGTQHIFYRKMGSGPAIVLLHGFPASGELWRNIWDKLSVNYTVIIPDMPGTGSTPLQGSAGIGDMAEMVKQILDKEQIQKAVIAGHSMGGYVALAFAGKYPENVTGLSLVHSTSEADDEEKIKTRRKAIALIQNGGKQGFINQMVPNLFSPAFKSAHPDVVSDQVAKSMQVDGDSMVNFYNAMIARHDTTSILQTANFPVQWICGVDDAVIPCKKILGKCHKAAINFVSFYNNCGHMSMLEAPERLVADLTDFVSYCNAGEYNA